MSITITQRAKNLARPIVWVDGLDYGGRVLARGASIPWTNPAELLDFHRRLDELLRSDVAVFPIGEFLAGWLNEDATLQREMRGRRRPGFALKRLLAADAPRGTLGTILRGAGEAYRSKPIVLAVPEPGCWLAWAHARANDGAVAEIGFEQRNAATLYVADFLRAFAESPVGAVLIGASLPRGAQRDGTGGSDRLASIANLVAHYRWELGMDLTTAHATAAPATRFAFLLASQPQEGVLTGTAVPAEFWSGTEASDVPDGAFYYVRVPEAASPENVLERLASLRSQATAAGDPRFPTRA